MTPAVLHDYGLLSIGVLIPNTEAQDAKTSECLQCHGSFDKIAAAGELGSFWGWMYNCGGNNAECLCTGQIAARNAAAMSSLA